MVVMNNNEYESKVTSMLEDEQTYKELKKDPAPALERKMNAKLLSLNKGGSLLNGLYTSVRTSFEILGNDLLWWLNS